MGEETQTPNQGQPAHEEGKSANPTDDHSNHKEKVEGCEFC